MKIKSVERFLVISFALLISGIFLWAAQTEKESIKWSRPIEPVVIMPYDPTWKSSFEKESQCIEQAFEKSRLKKIEHFGSTSVKGMAAKPIVDILVGLDEFKLDADEIEKLKLKGYNFIEKSAYCECFYFQKRTSAKKFNLSVVAYESSTWHYCVDVRDYLRAHSEAIMEYSNIKKSAIVRGDTTIDAYYEFKKEYVRGLLKKATEWRQSTGGVAADASPR